MTQADLFTWHPTHQVLQFPLDRQMGKIRHVAERLYATRTGRHAEYYRQQVTGSLELRLTRIGIPEPERAEDIAAFWQAVEVEMVRLAYRGRRPGGDAA